VHVYRNGETLCWKPYLLFNCRHRTQLHYAHLSNLKGPYTLAIFSAIFVFWWIWTSGWVMSVQIKHLLIINLLISMHGSRRRSHEKVAGKIARVIQLKPHFTLGATINDNAFKSLYFPTGSFSEVSVVNSYLSQFVNGRGSATIKAVNAGSTTLCNLKTRRSNRSLLFWG
jgi:hypothetical protein